MLWEYLENNIIKNKSKYILQNRKKVTFEQLLMNALKLSQKLHRQKYGILCYSDIFYAEALLACFAAGVTAVPLSNRYGDLHNQKIISAFDVQNLIIQESSEEVTVLEQDDSGIEEELKDVAWILATSGSTGRPKGVMLTEKAILNCLESSRCLVSVEKGDRFLVGRGFYHGSSIVGGLLMNLIQGVDIYCMEGIFQPRKILQILEQEKITMYASNTTAFYYICQAVRGSERNLSLRYCNIGAERMKEICFALIKEVFPDVDVIHSYGLTEACARATYQNICEADCEVDNVGRLLSSLSVEIRDTTGTILTKGKAGDVFLRGSQIMKGYYRNPEETAKVLQKGWLRTGDKGWLDASGNLHILGRQDDMIIRGGMNIYPQEIEKLLGKYPDIAEINVYGDRNGDITDKITADIVLEENNSYNPKELLQWCRKHMPSYQIPDKFNIVTKFQINNTGKMERKG